MDGRASSARFFAAIPNLKHRTVLMTMYAAGLRLEEALHLRVTDVDSARQCLRVEQGKGQKDRYTLLPPTLLVQLCIFRAVATTLRTIARDPKHLGADIGFLAVLHTWGQTLQHHPHVHCVVPGGGLSLDGTQWIPSGSEFFLPVRVLRRYFRRTFLRLLRAAYRQGKLRPRGSLAHLADPAAWQRWLQPLERTEWVVYLKPPFGGPRRVLKYLARYTHRVAISNQRLLSLQDDKVTFLWKDYAHAARTRTMTLDATEFLRRFLLHHLPRGFQHIRQYGLLGNRRRATALARCRDLLGQPPEPPEHDHAAPADEPPPRDACPKCRTGRLICVATLAPDLRAPLPWDTS